MQSELLCQQVIFLEMNKILLKRVWQSASEMTLVTTSCCPCPVWPLPYVGRPVIHAWWMECGKVMDATSEVRWQEAETSVLGSLWHCLWDGKLSCHEDAQAACQVWVPRGEGPSFQQPHGEFWREQWAFRSDLRRAHSWAAASEETLNQRHPGPDPQKYGEIDNKHIQFV